MAETQWKEVKNDRYDEVKLENAGDSLEGFIIDRREIKTAKSLSGKVNLVDLFTDKGMRTMMMPGELRQKLARVPISTRVRIVFTGRGKVWGPAGPVEGNKFDVFLDPKAVAPKEVGELIIA